MSETPTVGDRVRWTPESGERYVGRATDSREDSDGALCLWVEWEHLTLTDYWLRADELEVVSDEEPLADLVG